MLKRFYFTLPALVVAVSGCAPMQQQGGWNNVIAAGLGVPTAGLGGGVAAGNPVNAAAPLLVQLLMGRFGLTQYQAFGGAGALFALAQQRMTPSQFGQVRNAVPGIDHMLAAAPQLAPQTSGLLGMAETLAGGPNSGLGQLVGVAGAFQHLGINPSLAGQMAPTVLGYVENQGGAETMGLLKGALGI